jgi:hypothetical protein
MKQRRKKPYKKGVAIHLALSRENIQPDADAYKCAGRQSTHRVIWLDLQHPKEISESCTTLTSIQNRTIGPNVRRRLL